MNNNTIRNPDLQNDIEAIERNEQMIIQENNHPESKGSLATTVLETLEKKKTKRKRSEFEDCGKNTLKDVYSKKELHGISSFFLEKNDPLATRNRLCFLMGHAMLMGSETILGTQFADLFSMDLEDQGLSECVALSATITFGKTEKDGNIQYGSALRNKNVELCPIGALALHLFTRFHYENEPFPNFSKRSNWYNTFLFLKKDSRLPVSYDEQTMIYKEAFENVGIHSSKISHINRKSAINMIAHQCVPSDQQRQVGRWGSDRMVGCYVAGLPVEAIKLLAGFTIRQGDYFLGRSAATPPKDLQRMIFPDVEYWQEQFKSKNVQEDIAGPNFLGLLSYLRVVILQDTVLLKQKYPDFYLWSHSVFCSEDYLKFESEMLEAVARNEDISFVGQQIESVIPEVASAMKSGFSSQNNMMNTMNTQMMSSFEDLKRENTRLKNILADMLLSVGNRLKKASTAQGMEDTSPIGDEADAMDTSHAAVVIDGASCTYRINRHFESVIDVWREYEEGVLGHPSVQSLESDFGTAWRKDRSVSRFYCRRKNLYDEVKKIAGERDISCAEAAVVLEKRRFELKVSLDKLSKMISYNK